MEARIKILRGDNDKIATSSERLEAGQPLYNRDKNYLTIGDPRTIYNNVAYASRQPISTRNVKGWYSDDSRISKINRYEDFYYFGSNNNGTTLLKGVNELNINVGSSNYIKLKTGVATINCNVNTAATTIIPTGEIKTTLGSDTDRFFNIYSTSGDIETLTSKDLFSTNIGSTNEPITNIHTTSANIEFLTGDKLIGDYISMGPANDDLDVKIGSNDNDNTFCIKGASTSNVATNFKIVASYTDDADDSDYVLFNYDRYADSADITPQQLKIKGFTHNAQNNDFRCKIYGTLEVNAINLITT